MNDYTDGEICMLYRRAKDKKEQIQILTELTGLKEFEIEKILKEGGYLDLVEDKKKLIIQHYHEGLSDTKIAKAVSMSQAAVSKFLRQQGLTSNGKFNKSEEIKEGNNEMMAQAAILRKLNMEEQENGKELKSVSQIPDRYESLTPQQYYELTKMTLELLKLIWEV